MSNNVLDKRGIYYVSDEMKVSLKVENLFIVPELLRSF